MPPPTTSHVIAPSHVRVKKKEFIFQTREKMQTSLPTIDKSIGHN